MRQSAFYSLVFLSIHAAFGGQSIRVTGGSPSVTLPNKAPWTSIGASGQPMRWELRIHDFGQQWPTNGINLGPVMLYHQAGGPNWVDAASNFNSDAISDNGAILSGCCQGRTDMLVRVQRDVANLQWTFEVSDTTGGNYLSVAARILTFGPPSWAGFTINPNPGESVAFVRWFSSVVPMGTPIPLTSVTGDLGDWEFEGNLTDSSGHGLTMSGGAYSFVPTPTYPPVCNPGKAQSFRSGHPGTLDGTGSSAEDGGSTLTFLWQQLSGPTVTWGRTPTPRPIIGRGGVAQLTTSDQHSPQPVISGLAAGSYTFQLTVTDGSGQSGVCTVNDGAVETDDNDVVITNNPAVDTLLGPMVRFGASPWPWFDDRHRADADVQIADLDKYYGAYWDVADPGTITVTINSSIVTGVGTTFTTTFCNGPSGPSTSNGVGITVWYPTGVPGQTGRRDRAVASCQSDTQLTLTGIWFPYDVPDGSGLNYSDDSNYGTWAYNAAPANYYDNVAAFYALYYRSGIVDYLNAARKLADRFWECPQVDRGNSYVGNGIGGGWPSRSQSAMGLVLRALDGRPDMWPGMRTWWDFYGTNYLGPNGINVAWEPGLWDMREVAYQLALVSYCALDDPDTNHRNTCKSWVSTAISGYYTQTRAADGTWSGLSASYASWTTPPTSVTLTQGSTSVIGNGTSWTASQFASSGGEPVAMWFLNSSSSPSSNANGDKTTYSPAFIDSTHLMLDRPYGGTTGTHGWALAAPGTFLGFGWAAYSMGLLGGAFDLAAKSIADSDPATSALARSYNLDAANAINTYGYRAALKAVYYGVQYVNCQAPIPETNNPCTGGMDASGARVLSAEAIRGLMTAYAYNKDAGLKSLTDLLFNAMWAKPNTCPANSTLCVPDGVYVSAFDDGQWYVAGTPPLGAAPKYFGQMWGFSALSAWPAYRVGGPQPAAAQAFYLNVNRSAVPGAVAVRVTSAAADGTNLYTDCAASPCAVTAYGQGDRPAKLEYLSSSGAVLASAQIQLTQTQ
jgi:hypothetical protein